jgi:hypothetical protein
MKTLMLALTAVVLGGCCFRSDIRYWRVTDLTSKRTFYGADTVDSPVGWHGHASVVSSEGTLAGLASYELEAMDEATWLRESNAAVELNHVEHVGCVARVIAHGRRQPAPAAQ